MTDYRTVNPRNDDIFALATVVRGIMLGQVNCRGTFTLTANTGSTVVTAPTCRASSHVSITPTSATAAADQGSATGVFVTAGTGSFTVTHPNTAVTTRTFTYGIVG